MKRFQLTYCKALLAIAATSMVTCAASAAELEAFTDPYRSVDVPAPEIGVLDQILVQEGDAVKQGQLLARMDDTVLTAALEVARAAKDAQGSLRAAEAALKAREKQLNSYQSLRDRGNATQRELDRAENEHIQAASQLQSVREELEVRRLEYERTRAQLQHRQISSPINGYVKLIERDAGEFVSPNAPIVMTIVQLDTLKSEFSVPLAAVKNLKSGQRVTIRVGTDRVECHGIIELVSPVAEPKTSSVRVKIRIPNPKGDIQSGAVCVWDLKAADSPEQIGRKPTRLAR